MNYYISDLMEMPNCIAIDCGACYLGGRLAAICLDTGEEFYSSPNEMGGLQ